MKLPFWAEVERENEGVRFEAASLDFHHRVRAGYLDWPPPIRRAGRSSKGCGQSRRYTTSYGPRSANGYALEPHVSTGGVEAREAAAAARLPEGGD